MSWRRLIIESFKGMGLKRFLNKTKYAFDFSLSIYVWSIWSRIDAVGSDWFQIIWLAFAEKFRYSRRVGAF